MPEKSTLFCIKEYLTHLSAQPRSLKNISYEMYIARAGFILERLRPLNILDKTQDDEGVGKVQRSQVERGDPTLFLHFKNAEYARVFIEVSERHQVTHSAHSCGPRMASPSLDTGSQPTYSQENLDSLFRVLKYEILRTTKELLTRKYQYLLLQLEKIELPLDLKEDIYIFMNEKIKTSQETQNITTIMGFFDAFDHVSDAALTGAIEQIYSALTPEIDEKMISLEADSSKMITIST